MIGHDIYRLAEDLFPINRSITGDGVRLTLEKIKEHLPINIFEIASGTNVFDWTIPLEWKIRDAYILKPNGEKICDFKVLNLHVVGYSIPVNKKVPLNELEKHLYSIPEQPSVIPYVTSYYKERWGFCISHTERKKLEDGDYHVYIDSDFIQGSMTYAELILPGNTEKEICLSTYICHPSMANNEISGPALITFIAKYIMGLKNRRYTYRIILVPETIGSIAYLSKNYQTMKERMVAGFIISCVGDDRAFSYIASKYGNTYSDKVARNVMASYKPFIIYPFLNRGSDERQYNAPGIELPVCGICRSKYGEYPEYHTSADDLNLVSPSGFQGSYELFLDLITCIENNNIYRINCLCEPQLGKRGLYPTESYKGSATSIKSLMDFIAYADGSNDLIDISNIIGVPVAEILPMVDNLLDENLLIMESFHER